ncbi:MAG: SDR family oxidoreductase [Bordetella sp.]|nr:SDR family oxidoreductase [Bordetella sp.]
MSAPTERPPVTVVTGAAGGIGRALCAGLLRQGHAVVAVCRSAVTPGELPAGARMVRADLATQEGRNAVREAVARHHGYLTGLVNNAGIGMGSIRPGYYKRPVRADELDAETVARFLAVNAHAPVALALALLPLFTEGWGRIVNVGTSLTAMLRPGFLPYAMSKAALESASAVLALDLQASGIGVCVLNPGGPVDTPMARRDEEELRGRLIPAETMVAPVAWALNRDTEGVNGQRVTATRFDPLAPAASLAPIGWPQLANDSSWTS